ncbi:regulator of chromosome condensation 1/beta-lactamase-inhibitor protein II [Suillus tomentosus]|nr:regulator of chromosome condensation 1/beta-lactamase-inhibitor protein II [Suillus tomentosus]
MHLLEPHILRSLSNIEIASIHASCCRCRFVQAACGRSHSLLVGDDGQVWSAGANNLGQCGHPVTARSTFEAIEGPFLDGERLHVIKAAVGITFSIILTDDSGKVFSFGSGEKGQLG